MYHIVNVEKNSNNALFQIEGKNFYYSYNAGDGQIKLEYEDLEYPELTETIWVPLLHPDACDSDIESQKQSVIEATLNEKPDTKVYYLHLCMDNKYGLASIYKAYTKYKTK